MIVFLTKQDQLGKPELLTNASQAMFNHVPDIVVQASTMIVKAGFITSCLDSMTHSMTHS
jgi:hypothetical protein